MHVAAWALEHWRTDDLRIRKLRCRGMGVRCVSVTICRVVPGLFKISIFVRKKSLQILKLVACDCGVEQFFKCSVESFRLPMVRSSLFSAEQEVNTFVMEPCNKTAFCYLFA